MVRTLLQTDPSLGAALLRLTVGLVMFPHGAQKLLGWFGGHGYRGTMAYFTGTMNIPAVLAFAAIATEFFGSLALLLGLGGRVAAGLIGVVMVVAVATTHLQHGFFMNWFGSQKGEGFEFHILMLGAALAVVIRGSGAWSLDRALAAALWPL